VPAYSASAGDEAVELAAMAGLFLDPWQQLVLRESLGERQDGKWAAFEVGLVVARQNGKNALLEARELAGLFLLGERLIIHSAHEAATAAEAFRRLLDRIDSTPSLRKRVERVQRGKGVETIELRDGSRIWFRTRTKGGGRGFTADCVIFDEAMILPESVIGALVPTMSARSNSTRTGPQIWYTGSAVDQDKHEHGLVLSRIRDRGVKGEGALAYFEWSAEDDADPADPVSWAQANPGLGIRISLEHVELERQSMPAKEFAVERQGRGDWYDLSVDAGRIIPTEAWVALADPGSRIAAHHAFALDVDPGQSWATLAAAGEREDGAFHVGVVEHRRGIGWLVDSVCEWLERFPGAALVVDPRADLGDLLRALEERGVQPVRTSAVDYKDACSAFFQAVVEKRVRYMPPQPELDAAIAGARTKPLLDAWKWDRVSSQALITPLVACTLALWGARTQGAPEVWDLNEIVERLRREKEGSPEPEATPEPVATGPNFIPLDQMPARGGLFRP
jgi:hypothetical protein